MTCNKLFSLFIIGFNLIGAGCTSSDDSAATPGLPADAVTITATNAQPIAISAVATIETVGLVLGVDSSLPQIQNAINTVTDLAFNRDKNTSSVATGITESEQCTFGDPTSGTITVVYEETGTIIAGSESGTLTFASCRFGTTTFIGSFTYNDTWIADGSYTESGSGSLTIRDNQQSFTITLNTSETGNYNTDTYITNLSYSVSGTSLGGFLVETSIPLTGNYMNNGADAGQFIITGAGGTRLRITILDINTATYELDNGDGIFVSQGTLNTIL